MPLPLIPVISALAAGGTLVPHAAGGMIVTSAAGYVAGTYLSTSAIAGLLAAASTALGGGALYLSGLAGSLVGGAGLFGTKVGASGLVGALISAGLISSTPVWVPLAVGGAAVGGVASLGYGSYRLYRLRAMVNQRQGKEEVHFSEGEARMIERLIRWIGRG